MQRGRKTRAFATALSVALLGSGVIAASASASFHGMKIREVSAGTGPLDSSYAEIQMYAAGQEFLHLGAQLVVCNASCASPATFGSFTDVPNGANQSTVVFGDTGLTTKDFTVDLNLDGVAAGGALCYLSEPGFNDCVSWGTFSANSTLMGSYGTSAGTPAAALTPGMALNRSIAAGCPTALEPSDDTDNSAADFSVTTPNPRPNSVAPNEMTCGTSVPIGSPSQPNAPGGTKKKSCKKKRSSTAPSTGSGTANPPAYAAKKKCKKKRK
jgi:hypothetical protein